MKCIALIELSSGNIVEDQQVQFDTRTAAMVRLRELAAEGEKFSFELYEQVLVGGTVCQLETSPPKEVPQDRPEVEV